MAKQNKINKKREKRRRYRAGQKAERLDMRQGGRVALRRGAPVEKDIMDSRTSDSFSISRDEQNRPQLAQQPVEMSPPVTEAPVMPAQPTSQPAQKPVEMGRPAQQPVEMQPIQDTAPQPIEYSEEELGRQIDTIRMPRGPIRGLPVLPDDSPEISLDPVTPSDPQLERVRELAAQDVKMPDAEKVELGPMATAQQIAERDKLIAEQIEQSEGIVADQVEKIAQAETPQALTAAQMEAAQITETPEVVAARSEIRDESLAKAAKVDRVAPIEGVEVEIPEGALAERVVGTISETAKATAATNAGTSLARITRAKKQLVKAGLTGEQINEIGNDPEALEDKVADFSEEERGIIEGLPEEALVSTQLNGLLEGIENGEIPPWARPAVAQVEQMLAARGISASTVGRDNLFNAIIQSALPIAQSNAQAIQQSVAQQKDIEFKTAESNAQRLQQTALTNAQNVFNMDMAQFSADQQTTLFNSKFMQTVALTEANFDQQAAVQNAIMMSQANLAEADFYQKAQIQNAQAFLQTDMANLNTQQQANILKAQQEQQRLLSNQAATNATRQFNATSENQTQQYMTSLNAQISQFNTTQTNAVNQFNTQQQNAANALEFQVAADINKANAAMVNNVNQFNSQMEFNRDQWNSQNAQAVEQSNLAWRRQANTINTAAQNAINQQNAQNAFGMSAQAQSFLWQQFRDEADYVFRAAEGDENRKAQLYAQALANEGESAKNWTSTMNHVGTIINTMFGGKD